MSTKSIRIEKTEVKLIDLTFWTMLFMILIAVAVWISLFLNFGRNVESYRESLAVSQKKINGTEQKIEQLNDEIAKITQVLNSYEGK